MLKIGHRGAKGHAPENTLASIRKAWSLGADMVEIDVRVCRTGDAVLMHDDTVDRTTNGRGAVRRMSLDSLRGLDAGGGEPVPTLAEALAQVDLPRSANIEIKDPSAAEAVAEDLLRWRWSRSGIPASVIVSSFDFAALKRFHRLCPEAGLGALVRGGPEPALQLARRLPLRSVHLPARAVSPGLNAALAPSGLKVLAYTVNGPGRIRRLKALGVAGIISDFPERL